MLTQSGTGILGTGIISTSTVALAPSSPTDNGGPTCTMAIQATSSAYGAGTSIGAPTTDQRGITRNSPPSLGAYDFSSAPAALTVTSNPAGVTMNWGGNTSFAATATGTPAPTQQ